MTLGDFVLCNRWQISFLDVNVLEQKILRKLYKIFA